MRKKVAGFTLIETLIALFVFTLCINLALGLFNVMKRHPLTTDHLQDLNGLRQLTQYLALACDVEIAHDRLNYRYRDQKFTLSLVNNNLIIQPGTNILLLDLDKIEFASEGDQIIMSYRRNETIRKRVIRY